MIWIDVEGPVMIRGYVGTVVSLELESICGSTSLYDIELIDFQPEQNKIILRSVKPSEISTSI